MLDFLLRNFTCFLIECTTFFSFFFFGGAYALCTQKFLGQGSNTCYSRNQSHSRDNPGSLTRYTTRELPSLSLFLLFRATPVAYGSSQARGPTGAAAAGLHHSHSNMGSELLLHLHYSSRHCLILNPLNEVRDRTHVLMDTSWACYH